MPEAAHLSRSRLARLIADGAVSLDGRPATDQKAKVAEGETYEIAVPEAAETEIRAEEIAVESEGHPLFIHEIVRYASEHESLDVHSDLLDEALRARFDKVSLGARQILQLLAVAGIPMRHSTMASAAL